MFFLDKIVNIFEFSIFNIFSKFLFYFLKYELFFFLFDLILYFYFNLNFYIVVILFLSTTFSYFFDLHFVDFSLSFLLQVFVTFLAFGKNFYVYRCDILNKKFIRIVSNVAFGLSKENILMLKKDFQKYYNNSFVNTLDVIEIINLSNAGIIKFQDYYDICLSKNTIFSSKQFKFIYYLLMFKQNKQDYKLLISLLNIYPDHNLLINGIDLFNDKKVNDLDFSNELIKIIKSIKEDVSYKLLNSLYSFLSITLLNETFVNCKIDKTIIYYSSLRYKLKNNIFVSSQLDNLDNFSEFFVLGTLVKEKKISKEVFLKIFDNLVEEKIIDIQKKYICSHCLTKFTYQPFICINCCKPFII